MWLLENSGSVLDCLKTSNVTIKFFRLCLKSFKQRLSECVTVGSNHRVDFVAYGLIQIVIGIGFKMNVLLPCTVPFLDHSNCCWTEPLTLLLSEFITFERNMRQSVP